MPFPVIVIGVLFVSSLVWLVRNWHARGPTDLWRDEDIVARESPRAHELRPPHRPDPHARTPLIEVGYWATPRDRDRPQPRDFVDPAWDPEERMEVRDYLAGGIPLPREEGQVETCAFCGSNLSGAERTDATYVWPTGLEHYVMEHATRLPGLFVLHVRRNRGHTSPVSGTFHEPKRRDREWWDSLQGP